MLDDQLDDEVQVLPESPRQVRPRFLVGGAAYAGSAIVQRLASLLVLPFLLHAVSPADYGQIALLTSIAGVASVVLSFGLEAAIVRMYFQLASRPEDQSTFLRTIGTFLVVVPIAVWLAGALLATAIGQGPGSNGFLILALGTSIIQMLSTVVVFALLRLQERLRDYTILSLGSTIAYVALTLILVVALGQGVLGWLIATLVSYLLILVAGMSMLRFRLTAHPSRHLLLAALVFSLPLLPHLLAHWGLSLSDRLILGISVSRDDIGVYNLGYQLAMPIGMLTAAVNKAATPHLSRAAAGGGDHGLGRMASQQVWFAAFLGMAVILLAPVAIEILLPTSYAPPAAVASWVAVGYVFYGWYLVPIYGLSVLTGTTRWIWVATVIAATINIGLNLLLVPRYGMMVAAITTAIGDGSLLVGVSLMAKRTKALTIPIEGRRAASGVVVIGIATAATALLTNPFEVAGAVARIAVTTGVFCSLGSLPKA